jgi:hypothetical protein
MAMTRDADAGSDSWVVDDAAGFCAVAGAAPWLNPFMSPVFEAHGHGVDCRTV